MENTAWSILTGNFKDIGEDDIIKNDDKVDLDDNTIIKRPGFVPEKQYDDEV